MTAVLAHTVYEGTLGEPANMSWFATVMPSEVAALILHLHPKHMEVRKGGRLTWLCGLERMRSACS